jgi:hypothetical protein
METKDEGRLLPAYMMVGILVLAILAYYPVFSSHFLNYDDPSYVTSNDHVKAGITADSVKWAFTTFYFYNWHPLTWVSHMLDIQFFGLDPVWHHLVNLLFHIVNTLFLFLLFEKMTGATWKSLCLAALFGLHPLHVESVAWVADRKDVLSTFRIIPDNEKAHFLLGVSSGYLQNYETATEEYRFLKRSKSPYSYQLLDQLRRARVSLFAD